MRIDANRVKLAQGLKLLECHLNRFDPDKHMRRPYQCTSLPFVSFCLAGRLRIEDVQACKHEGARRKKEKERQTERKKERGDLEGKFALFISSPLLSTSLSAKKKTKKAKRRKRKQEKKKEKGEVWKEDH